MTDTKTWLWSALLIAAFSPFFVHVYRLVSAELLRKTGVEAVAEIVEVSEARDAVRHLYAGTQVDVHLRYTVRGQVVTGSYRRAASAVELQTLKPGATLRIVYDPRDPSRIVPAES